jgi:hypothetical protein
LLKKLYELKFRGAVFSKGETFLDMNNDSINRDLPGYEEQAWEALNEILSSSTPGLIEYGLFKKPPYRAQ